MYASNWPLRWIACCVVWLLADALLAGPGDDHYTVAATHYSRGRWEAAAEEFESFLRQYPDDPRSDSVVFFLGESLVQSRRYAEAHERFAEFLQRAKEDRYAEQAQFRLGETAFFQGDYRQAEQSLERFRTEHPDSPLNAYATVYMGEVALAAGDAPRAEALYRHAIERYREGPLDSQCRFGLAHALELQGHIDEALQFYRVLAESDQGELADDAQLQIGSLLFKKGEYDAAIAALAAFDTRYPQSPLQASAGYWSGMALLAAARYGEAVTAFSTASSSAGAELAPAIEFSWGEALRKSGDSESASARFQTVLQRWPDSAWADDALQVLAETAFQSGDYDTVVQLGREFAEKHAGSRLRPFITQTMARALLKLERFSEAVEVLESLDSDEQAGASGTSAAVSEAMRMDGSRSPAEVAAAGRANRYYRALALLGVERPEAALEQLQAIQPEDEERELAAGLLVAQASCQMALRRYADAVEPLQRYLADQPQGAEAAACWARLVVALAESGDGAGAERAYEQFREQFAGHALLLPATEYLAERAAAQRQWDAARSLYQFLSENTESAEYAAKGLAGLGKIQLKTGSAQDSAQTFETLLDRSPDGPQAAEAAFLRAKSLESSDQLTDALQAYQAVIDRHPTSAHAARALLACAQLQERLQNPAEALALLERFLQAHRDSPDMPTALYQQAWLLADQQRAGEADEAFRQIAEQHAGSRYWADAVYRLAERAAQSAEPAAAEQWLDRLLAADVEPDVRAHALYLKGKVAVDAQQWEQALEPLEWLARQFSDHRLKNAAAYWIAESLFRLERYEEAAERLKDLEQATQAQPEPWTAMVPLRRAQILAQQGRWAEAHDLAASIAERFPDFRQQHEADYLLGRCLSSQARFSEAREAYQRVTGSASGGRTETAAMAQWMIGETYFHQKDYEQAIRAYHRVESLYPFPRWQAAALLQAAKCHELKGERQEAERLYTQVIKDHPDTEYAAGAAQRLKAPAAAHETSEALLGASKH